MSETAKLFYVQGIKDGQTSAAYLLPPEFRDLVLRATQAKGFTPGDYVKELDKLFEERENLNIFVLLAYGYVTRKLQGANTSQELEQILVELRKTMAK